MNSREEFLKAWADYLMELKTGVEPVSIAEYLEGLK